MTDPAALTECPKCFGTGTVPHKHIEDGTCFLCNRAGQCTEAAANSWLAKQARIPYVRSIKAPVSTERVTMDMDLGPVFGRCTVFHSYSAAPGRFSVRLNAVKDGITDEYGELHCGLNVWFQTVRGRVVIDRENLVNGMRYGRRIGQLQHALQAAM